MKSCRALWLGLVFLLYACVPNATQAVPTVPTPDAAPMTETPTVVWFPPTNTPTQIPAFELQPTQQQVPGVGDVIFTDDFSNPDIWSTASSSQAAAIVDYNQLTLTIKAPKISVISLRREPTLANFFAEVTARTNLCSGKDEYGILVRSASGADFYRFVLNCEGLVRVDRVQSGTSTSLQPATPSGDAPPGSPGETRIGVWASGTELRFFLNGRYQFNVFDPVFRSGTIGFFARSISETPLNVAFSDLVVSDVSYASPTPTPTPSNTPKPTRTPRPTP